MDNDVEDVEEKRPPRINKKFLKLSAVASTVSLIILICFSTLTNPNSGPVTILIFLLLSFIFFSSLATVVVQLISAPMLKKPLALNRLLYTSFVLGVGGVFLVGLQTLGQLQLIDVVLALMFEAIVIFYFFRRF